MPLVGAGMLLSALALLVVSAGLHRSSPRLIVMSLTVRSYRRCSSRCSCRAPCAHGVTHGRRARPPPRCQRPGTAADRSGFGALAGEKFGGTVKVRWVTAISRTLRSRSARTRARERSLTNDPLASGVDELTNGFPPLTRAVPIQPNSVEVNAPLSARLPATANEKREREKQERHEMFRHAHQPFIEPYCHLTLALLVY